MQIMIRTAAVLAAAGFAFSATAQDSVSTGGSDALSPYAASQQVTAYTVDLTRRFGSWPNTRFGIAPILKTTQGEPGFFSNLGSSQGISPDLLRNVPGPSTSFPVWYEAGVGINEFPINQPPTQFRSVDGIPTNQFALGISEFANSPVGSYNGLITGVVNQDPRNPRQLFVRRALAVSTTDGVTGVTGSIGFGTIDAHGNAYVRADNNSANMLPPTDTLSGQNIFRARTLDRANGSFNLASPNAALRQAGDFLFNAPADPIILTPGNLPQSLAANGTGLFWNTNFNGEGFYGEFTSTNVGTTHRPGTVDHRGQMGFRPVAFPGLNPGGTAVGTYGVLTRTDGAAGNNAISLWSVDANGALTGSATFILPGHPGSPQTNVNLQHPCYPHLSTYPTIGDPSNPIGVPAFRGYGGAVGFRGGNGHVAIGRDPQTGEGLIAASLYLFNSEIDWTQAIVVCRFDENNPSNYTWEVAAQVDPFGIDGLQDTWQPIHGDFGTDGAAFSGSPGEFDGVLDLNPASPTYDAPIGVLYELRLVTGGSPVGPSLSPPAFDANGNLYFIGAVQLNKWDSQNETVFFDPDSALIKAHRVTCGSGAGYRLELIAELGDTFLGRNSRTRWQIQFMGIASAGGGLNPGAFFSGNVLGQNFNGLPYSSLTAPANASPSLTFNPRQDNRAFGGLVFNASIVYDVNNDGQFVSPTGAGGDPSSPDQPYNALIYIGYMPCTADVTGPSLDGIPDEQVNAFDLNFYVSQWISGNPNADITGSALDGIPDGAVNAFDLNFFIAAWLRGCD